LNDRRLIQRILQGDAAAERQLYEAHVDRIFRLACRMTGDAALAEDLTQDTFIRAFDRLADFRGDGPLGGWLHRVATSVIFSALRKRKRVLEFERPEEDLSQYGREDVGGDPDLRRQLGRAVASLDDNHRLVFVMHDMEGFTHQEIAAAMDTPVGTAKARLSRARSKLKEILTLGMNSPGPSLEMDS
jgi:RNA polymerase sigma-70 factor, ECF subfamily